MIEEVKERLKMFGYVFQNGDDLSVKFACEKVENTIKNDCNISEIPDGLMNVAVDMAAGEFFALKKVFEPSSLANIDLDEAVKQITEGDTTISFDGSTPEARLDGFIECLKSYGREEFSCYRKIRW